MNTTTLTFAEKYLASLTNRQSSKNSTPTLVGVLNENCFRHCWLHELYELIPANEQAILFSAKALQASGLDTFCKVSSSLWHAANSKKNAALALATTDTDIALIQEAWSEYKKKIRETESASFSVETVEDAIEALKSNSKLKTLHYTTNDIKLAKLRAKNKAGLFTDLMKAKLALN